MNADLPMDDLMLPPLPEPAWSHTDIYGDTRYGYDAYQMRGYAKKAVEAHGLAKQRMSKPLPLDKHLGNTKGKQ